MRTIEILFWVFLGLVFYTYVGYGILLYFLVKIRELFVPSGQAADLRENLPEVTLLIAAYNEQDVVRDKMDNTGKLDYPSEKIRIVWVTDGSTDDTNRILSEYKNAELLHETKRSGKTAAINRAMPFVSTPIVVFTDANTMLNSNAVKEIVKAFNDPLVGCVAGEKRIESKEKGKASSEGEGIYWKYESALKNLDSRLNSAVGAAGELFAIRRELFENLATDTLLDDFMLSMIIVKRGFKIVYCKNAYAIETGSYNMAEEKKRKVRIAAGGIQSVWRLKELLNPFKYPIFSFQYISHRVLRWTITPILLFALFPINILLAIITDNPIYPVMLIFQILFYMLAILGMVMNDRHIKIKILFIPYYFLFMNLNVINGFSFLFKKTRGDGTWEKAKRS